MIVKKAERKTERPDYGSTITPKQAAAMLAFLTEDVSIVSTEGLYASPINGNRRRCPLCLRPKVFGSGEADRRLSRYELSDVCCLRDCLSALMGTREGPANGNGTRAFTVTKSHPLYQYAHGFLQHLDPRDKSDDASKMRRAKIELDETLRDTLEFYRCHLEARRGVVMIVPDEDRGW